MKVLVTIRQEKSYQYSPEKGVFYDYYIGVAPMWTTLAGKGDTFVCCSTDIRSFFLRNLLKELKESPMAEQIFICPDKGDTILELSIDLTELAYNEYLLAYQLSSQKAKNIDRKQRQLNLEAEKKSQRLFNLQETFSLCSKISSIEGTYFGENAKLLATPKEKEYGSGIFEIVFGLCYTEQIAFSQYFNSPEEAFKKGFIAREN